jgi:hypothetical protein
MSMELGEITPEIKEAYGVACQFPGPSLIANLCNALRDQLAARRKLEFPLGLHRETNGYCQLCEDPYPPRSPHYPGRDPRHNYTDADWQALAERELSE